MTQNRSRKVAVTTWYTEEEREAMKANAAAFGMNRSEFTRHMTLFPVLMKKGERL